MDPTRAGNIKTMSELNRYQNPEVFEKLAMAYAAGTLHGRARQRFEKLKDEHFYLEATTSAYESKFGSLVELLPNERPSDQVWKNIESTLKAEAAFDSTEKSGWFSWLKPIYTASALAVLLAVFLFLNLGSKDNIAYAAVLEDTQSNPIAITKVNSDLSVSVSIMKELKLEDGTVLKLWCHPKNGGKPREMGVVSSSGETTITITPEEYQNMNTIGKLEITADSHGSAQTPKRTSLLKGFLNPVKEQ